MSPLRHLGASRGAARRAGKGVGKPPAQGRELLGHRMDAVYPLGGQGKTTPPSNGRVECPSLTLTRRLGNYLETEVSEEGFQQRGRKRDPQDGGQE